MYFAKFKKRDDWSDPIFLILESEEDVIKYAKASNPIVSNDVWIAWKKMHKNKQRNRSFHDHMSVMPTDNICSTIVNKILFGNDRDCTIDEYNREMSKTFFNKYKNMIDLIDKGHSLRVNSNMGYCDMNDKFEIKERFELSDDKMLSYWLLKSRLPDVKNEFFIKIHNENLIIENDYTLDYVFRVSLKNVCNLDLVSEKECHIIYNFKSVTNHYDKEDYIKMFQYAVDNGLKNIYAETSFSDLEQFELLKSVIEYVMMNNPDKYLNVYLFHNKLYDGHNVETKVGNIKIFNF